MNNAQGIRARLRRADRQAAVDLPHRSAAAASSATTPGWTDAADDNGNTGVWAQLSADLELGLVYVPVEMPTGDYYGGHRPGNTLFAESLVALDLKTGKRKWHYQTDASRRLGLRPAVRADPVRHGP